MLTETEIVTVEQDPHPDGAIFGLVEQKTPAEPFRTTRTVLYVESGKTAAERRARSMVRGLRGLLRSELVMHPHVWPSGMAVVP